MRKTRGLARLILCAIMIVAIAVAYAPVNCATASAASFSTSTKVGGMACTKVKGTAVTLTWNKLSGASGYQVYKKSSSSGSYSKVKTTDSTTWTRTGLTTGKKCWYKVRAYKTVKGKKQYSKYSEVITATPKLTAPTVTPETATDGVKLTWKKIAGATGYQVYRSTSEGGTYSKLGSTTGITYKNTSVTKGTTYYYKVRAYRDGSTTQYSDYSKVKSCAAPGSSSSSSSTTTTTTAPGSTSTADKTPPAAVTGLKTTGASGYVTVAWNAVTGATGYEVQRATSANGTYSKIGTSTSTSYKDSNVTSGSTYYYKVRAYKKVDGSTINGEWNQNKFSRDVYVQTALSYLGVKEGTSAHKAIIDLYNNGRVSGSYKMTYSDAWCACFVSAVGIKCGYTDIIYRNVNCGSMLSAYKKDGTYSTDKKYVPKGGDIVFFDWDLNGTPNHVGLVANATSTTVTTIEGNYSDMVKQRTYSVGYKYEQAYGIPKYDNVCGIKYNGTSSVAVLGSASEALAKAGISSEPAGYSDISGEYKDVEKKVFDGVGCGEKTSEYDKMLYMIKKVRAEADTKGISCSESEYYAAFIFRLCQEANMEASIVTENYENSPNKAWVEVSLDGKMYKVDASVKDAKPVKFTPETTDVEPADK